jgi:hypothetical protein
MLPTVTCGALSETTRTVALAIGRPLGAHNANTACSPPPCCDEASQPADGELASGSLSVKHVYVLANTRSFAWPLRASSNAIQWGADSIEKSCRANGAKFRHGYDRNTFHVVLTCTQTHLFSEVVTGCAQNFADGPAHAPQRENPQIPQAQGGQMASNSHDFTPFFVEECNNARGQLSNGSQKRKPLVKHGIGFVGNDTCVVFL